MNESEPGAACALEHPTSASLTHMQLLTLEQQRVITIRLEESLFTLDHKSFRWEKSRGFSEKRPSPVRFL